MKFKLKFKMLPLKWIYLISIMIIILITLGLYTTYAMFNVNTNSGNDSTDNKTYNFNIDENQKFSVVANSIYSFNVLVKNTTNNPIYFEIYYTSSDDLTNVIVAEVVDDKTSNPTALNTGFNLNSNEQKVVPIVIVNNNSTTKNISINIARGFVGNAIVYNDNTNSNGTKITATYNLSDVSNKKVFDMDDCVVENNVMYCVKK